MVVGIDVCHDADRKNPSVAGIVGSTNDRFSLWYSRTVIQSRGQELIDGLLLAFVDLLKAYHQRNHAWPEAIIIFRDGVNEQQFEALEEHEVKPLYEFYKKTTNGNEKFGFVIVQKKVHTRVMLKIGDHVENPPSGTVVDESITNKGRKNFYLISQKASHGTVTPTRYVSFLFFSFHIMYEQQNGMEFNMASRILLGKTSFGSKSSVC